MISTLQKRLQYALLSLVGPSSSSRIGSHIGHYKLVSEPRPTIGAPLIDRSLAFVDSRRKPFRSLVISESRTSFTSLPLRRSGEKSRLRCFDLLLFPFKLYLGSHS